MTEASLIIAVATGIALFGFMCAYDRWIWPLIKRQWVDKTLAKIHSTESVPAAKQSEIGLSIDSVGITVNRLRPGFGVSAVRCLGRYPSRDGVQARLAYVRLHLHRYCHERRNND